MEKIQESKYNQAFIFKKSLYTNTSKYTNYIFTL